MFGCNFLARVIDLVFEQLWVQVPGAEQGDGALRAAGPARRGQLRGRVPVQGPADRPTRGRQKVPADRGRPDHT